ncbi:hypothetical protein AB6A40_007641 [Gnathostoma spinigerum]|uniref:Uncharacterized protein n=1 Tax=Gnathostoma spinigerum TaxID=75299 RepID=A0ABD6EWH9_9BILA
MTRCFVRLSMAYKILFALVLSLCGIIIYKNSMASRAMTSAVHSVVYVTVPNITVGKTIARAVVEGKLAACVNILPIVTSIYEWENKVEESPESLLIIKTKTAALEKLKKKVEELHPYDVPEFISSPIVYGSDGYLKWIDDQVLP